MNTKLLQNVLIGIFSDKGFSFDTFGVCLQNLYFNATEVRIIPRSIIVIATICDNYELIRQTL